MTGIALAPGLVYHPGHLDTAAQAELLRDIEAVLAWAVREGVTNVIRHSHARSCTLRVTAGASDAQVEVTDDGAGPAAMNGDAGSGLAGAAGAGRQGSHFTGPYQVRVIPVGGHNIPQEAPAVVAEAVLELLAAPRPAGQRAG